MSATASAVQCVLLRLPLYYLGALRFEAKGVTSVGERVRTALALHPGSPVP